MNYKAFALLAILALTGSAAAARKRVNKKDVAETFPTVADALIAGNYTALLGALEVRELSVPPLKRRCRPPLGQLLSYLQVPSLSQLQLCQHPQHSCIFCTVWCLIGARSAICSSPHQLASASRSAYCLCLDAPSLILSFPCSLPRS